MLGLLALMAACGSNTDQSGDDSTENDAIHSEARTGRPSGRSGGTGSSGRNDGNDAGTTGSSGAGQGGSSGKSTFTDAAADSTGPSGSTGASPSSGASGTAGASASSGTSGTIDGGLACVAGSSTTQWATGCATEPPACAAGTWTTGGPDPDHAAFRLVAQSTHFAIYSDETLSTALTQSALDTLENGVWKHFFGPPIFLKEPLCNQTNKIKASIHVHSDWSLTGGAFGTGRMGMWIGTGALDDHWGLAHEFTHAVQSVSGGMRCNSSNTCGWFYESHANFMPHQLPEYRSSFHCSEMLPNAPHLYLGSTRNRYCNWQFMEYLKDKYCYRAVNEIWTGAPIDDPFSAIARNQGWTTEQLNDFFGEWAMHNVTWDYQNPAPTLPGDTVDPGAAFRAAYGLPTDVSRPERRLRLTRLVPLDTNYASNRRFATPSLAAPQRWGYNIVRLHPDDGATSIRVRFRGVLPGAANPDFRWGLVATNAAITSARYSPLQRGTDGDLRFCVSAGESVWLVVMATPSVQQKIVWDQPYASVARYPYMIALEDAWPDGYRGGAPEACPTGTVRHPNGAGCAPASLAESVFVGPNARVLGGNVSGNARIEDHAIVLSGATVTGGTVAGLTVLSRFTVSGNARVETSFYPPGFFESNQGLSGTATLYGDVEYRGAGTNRSSGTFSGFVDANSPSSSQEDSSPQGPYLWRE